VTGGTVLRVFAFEPSRSGLIDTTLRDVLLPALCMSPGIVDAYVGRQGPGEVGERFIASVWASNAAMEASAHELQVLDEHVPGVLDPERARVECRPVAIELRVDRPQIARIMRVFRGQVADGELESYIEDVRTGAFADASANPGLVALYLGIEPPDRFLTVSTWTDWESIASATGGNIYRPISTAHPDRIHAFDASHYEVLPETARPALQAVTAAIA
jgi:hypothetical protein